MTMINQELADLQAVIMSAEDLELAVLEGVWYPECPHCGSSTATEPDADCSYCQICDRQFRIINVTY